MPASMPPIVVLILCKVVSAGPADMNAGWTNHQNLKWDLAGGVMTCRRNEVALTNPAENNGADPKPYTEMDCWRSGFMMGAQWDATHQGSRYRFWRVACPVPIVDTETGDILDWHIPSCSAGKLAGVVVCENDIQA